jgi:NAD(P)-dependent dehydrogenase (short-subunit alcohol dehydrogenase family)
MTLAGKIILITGAGSGIGAATARELARRGAVPVLADIDAASLEATAATIEPRPLTVTLDVTQPAACEEAVATTLARHGRLDVVWANAGIASFGPLAHTDPAAWRRVIDVNLLGVFNTVHAALPAVRAQRGHVLVTASIASFAHPPAMSAYAASKAAVEAACNAWRIELATHGVTVGAIHASWVATPMVAEGGQHPAFKVLRDSSPPPLRRETDAATAACWIADGIERRAARIWVPGWVRWLSALRALLHTKGGERGFRQAAPEMERLYLEVMATEGREASSFAPRELARRRGEGRVSTSSAPSPLPSPQGTVERET